MSGFLETEVAGQRIDWRRKRRAEFAGGEGVEGAEAGGELLVGQAVFAVERTEKIRGGAVALLRIAFQARRDEVAVGIASRGHARHDVIDALAARVRWAQGIKAAAPRARGWPGATPASSKNPALRGWRQGSAEPVCAF